MNKAVAMFLLLIFYSPIIFSQVLPGTPRAYSKTAIVTVRQPLVIIGTLETTYHNLIIDRDNLEVIKTYKDSLELVPFGEKGKGGIVLARLKKNVPLLRLEEVFDLYKVPAANRTLKIMVNKRLINPALFLADVSAIIKIEKIKQDITNPLLYSLNKDEEFLNFVVAEE